ncbi:hypothetical protein [Bacillus toyonensis]|uniref:hypothetical protein n=1 Tax=Bacillus toyonensis TaxID=155322 RepID=UPI000BF61D89|nr:hypothetical protein [Bacillus toyonensis]PGF04990.1 hypothetical protein COM61_00700 [Bacillus toyonensis]
MRTKQLHVPFEQGEYAFGYIEINESGELKQNIPFVSRVKERLYLSVVGFKRNQEGHFILLMEMYYKQVGKLTQGKENTFFVLESKDIDTSNDEPIVLESFEGDSLDFDSYVKERL